MSEEVFCCHTFEGALTFGKRYPVLEQSEDWIRVATDQGPSKKIPLYCFSPTKPAEVVKIDLEYLEGLPEATLTFDNGEKRWLIFGTLDRLRGVLEQPGYLAIPHLVITRSLEEADLAKIIQQLQNNNDLMGSTIPWES